MKTMGPMGSGKGLVSGMEQPIDCSRLSIDSSDASAMTSSCAKSSTNCRTFFLRFFVAFPGLLQGIHIRVTLDQRQLIEQYKKKPVIEP